jgi:hypothetical protein
MYPSTKQDFSAELSGAIDGAAIAVSGGGILNPSGGIAKGTYRVKCLPPRFSPITLCAFLLTGYPHVCKVQHVGQNPFGDRPYKYTRTLTFQSGGELRLNTVCTYANDRLVSSFDVVGVAHTPELVSADPIIESWEFVRPGLLRGHFEIVWNAFDGSRFIADAKSEYEYEPDNMPNMPERLLRHIDISPSYENEIFSLYQRSALLPEHESAST